jgi:LysR family nod box-dependent transcriptional activator
MHLQRLDLNLLVALDALLTTQSVTRAAEVLSISQPAMSGALGRLRKHFGDELIQRSGRSMVLTPFGMDLAARASALLNDATELARLRPGFDPATTDRVFTLVASDYAMAVFLPLALPFFEKDAPHIALRTEVRAPDHARRFALGMIDFVLVPHHMAMQDTPGKPLFEDQYVCVVWQDNQQVGPKLSADQFLQMGHIVRVNPAATDLAGDERTVRAMGLQRRTVATVPSFGMLPRMVIGTSWIATVQRRLAEHAARHYPIRVIEHPLALPPITMMLQWPSVRDADTGNTWMREKFVSIASAL